MTSHLRPGWLRLTNVVKAFKGFRFEPDRRRGESNPGCAEKGFVASSTTKNYEVPLGWQQLPADAPAEPQRQPNNHGHDRGLSICLG